MREKHSGEDDQDLRFQFSSDPRHSLRPALPVINPFIEQNGQLL